MSKSAVRRRRTLHAFVEVIDRWTLWDQHDGICGICKTPVGLEHMTIDHVVPLSKGGLHSYANTQPAHEECNRHKGNTMPESHVPQRKKRKMRYFNRPHLA
jgi:5-methylcytosine-specific restriction endonuclease McrA